MPRRPELRLRRTAALERGRPPSVCFLPSGPHASVSASAGPLMPPARLPLTCLSPRVRRTRFRANIAYVWAFAAFYFVICWLVLSFKRYDKR